MPNLSSLLTYLFLPVLFPAFWLHDFLEEQGEKLNDFFKVHLQFDSDTETAKFIWWLSKNKNQISLCQGFWSLPVRVSQRFLQKPVDKFYRTLGIDSKSTWENKKIQTLAFLEILTVVFLPPMLMFDFKWGLVGFIIVEIMWVLFLGLILLIVSTLVILIRFLAKYVCPIRFEVKEG